MYPIMTLKSWGQQHPHMMETHGLREASRRLVHDPAFWAVIALTMMLVALIFLAMNTPRDLSQSRIPQHPYPVYIY